MALRLVQQMRAVVAASLLLVLPAVAVLVAPQAADAQTDGFQVTTTSLPGVTVGQSYSLQLQATGGTTPYEFYLIDEPSYPLPPGLTLSASGLISGTVGALPVDLPTTYNIQINAMDYSDFYAYANLTITVTPADYVSPPLPLQITTTAIPEATFAKSYSFQMQATGGTMPYQWIAPDLPQGFTMSRAGLITGSNALPEQAAITVTLYDSGEGYTNLYGVNSVQVGQQHTQQNYTFTVTSGYPELDPTLFEVSAALAPYNPSPTVAELEASIDDLLSSGLANLTILTDEIENDVGNVLCDLTPVAGGKGCLIPGLPGL